MAFRCKCWNLAAALCLAVVPSLPTTALAQGTVACQDGSPGLPVGQFRTIPGQGTFELWPRNLRPADPTGMALPANRDSTAYTGSQRPGQSGGLEFFNDLDIVEDATGTHLLMAYNAGFQVWDIGGAFAAAPQLLSQRDGWNAEFNTFAPPNSEDYFLIWGIAAINPPAGTDTLVALAGDTTSVGLTIWDLADKSNPAQLYQDTSNTGVQVAAVNIGGRSYAFLAAGDGVQVYDMSRARELGPCFEDSGSAMNLCGGNADPVWRGRLEPWPWGRARYLDVLKVSGGGPTQTFVVVSDAFSFNGLGVEIREVLDPAALPPTSTPIVEGLDTSSEGVSLFDVGGTYYLARTDSSKLDIRDVSACITGGAGCSLGDLEASFDTVASPSYLQFSESNGRPFLYRGFHSFCSAPSTTTQGFGEYLLDLSELASAGTIVDVRGENYQDPNHMAPPRVVDYWSSYYDQSTDGFSTFAPHVGRFQGPYFYRAGQTIFDIHQWQNQAPTVQITPTSPGRWLTTPGQFEWIQLLGACDAGQGSGWSWSAANAAGTPAVDPVPIIEDLDSGLAQVRGDLCANDDYPAAVCANRGLEVAVAVSCDGVPATGDAISLTVSDPRPFFEVVGIVEAPAEAGPPPVFPSGQVLNFRALSGGLNEIGGKPLTDFLWEVMPVLGGQTLVCNPIDAPPGFGCDELSLVWDTGSTPRELIFSDGFESGAPAVGERFVVALTATNEHASVQRSVLVELTP